MKWRWPWRRPVSPPLSVAELRAKYPGWDWGTFCAHGAIDDVARAVELLSAGHAGRGGLTMGTGEAKTLLAVTAEETRDRVARVIWKVLQFDNVACELSDAYGPADVIAGLLRDGVPYHGNPDWEAWHDALSAEELAALKQSRARSRRGAEEA